MSNSSPSSPPVPCPPSLREQVADRYLSAARADPSAFIGMALKDNYGGRLEQSRVHLDLQAFLTAHSRALVELPRDHGKSFQVCGRIVWELGHCPALRVKLVCGTSALAADRSRFLREAIAHNPFVSAVFPGLRRSTPWAVEAFTVDRPASAIGPTVAAFGVGAGSTGARADLLVCDDIVDVKAMHSRGDRERVKAYFRNNLMNLLEPDGRFWNLSTPWHPDDLNAHLKANPAYALFRRAVGPNLEPVWPEKWSPEKLAKRRAEIGEASFARGYRLAQMSEDEVLVRPEWVRLWSGDRDRGGFEPLVLAVDPAVTASESADASALVVAGVCPAGPDGGRQVRVLEATARRVRTPELVQLIDDADRRWQPDVILFETNGAFAGLKDVLTGHARFGPKVVGRPATRSKAARVAALGVPVQNGAVLLRGDGGMVDAGQRELFEQLTTFPFAPHDDLVDALAAAVAHLLHHPDPRVWV